MIEQFTLIELEAALKGRAIPGDLRCGESIAQYLHREIQSLAKERDNLREDRDGLLESGAHLL
ncbi:hypothetical protein [Pseudomonas putida]|uniref:Uncharacterized protein n=1 Tax=Pseudomonas putida TaxID=303 RepID=A0A2S3WFN8_PSEPU|nr:hypothetical protein [Pseudomonas putida]POF89683.1 hypothetical protein BGP80_17620 [Pseudomonas putida]POF89763.1 hypothetical protein BGP80_18065 [Pseudomonas putida]